MFYAGAGGTPGRGGERGHRSKDGHLAPTQTSSVASSQFSFLSLRGPTGEILNGSQIDSELENPDVSQLGVPPDPPLTLAPAKLL